MRNFLYLSLQEIPRTPPEQVMDPTGIQNSDPDLFKLRSNDQDHDQILSDINRLYL